MEYSKSGLKIFRRKKILVITYNNKGKYCIKGFFDAAWRGERPSGKSMNDYTFTFLVGISSWQSKQQTDVAQSSIEADFVSWASTISEAL